MNGIRHNIHNEIKVKKRSKLYDFSICTSHARYHLGKRVICIHMLLKSFNQFWKSFFGCSSWLCDLCFSRRCKCCCCQLLFPFGHSRRSIKVAYAIRIFIWNIMFYGCWAMLSEAKKSYHSIEYSVFTNSRKHRSAVQLAKPKKKSEIWNEN